MNKFDLYPTKSLFINGKNVELFIYSSIFPTKIEIKVFHLRTLVFTKHFTITEEKTILTLPDFMENQSYSVECIRENEIYYTAFETYSDWKKAPRYGFLSDFSDKDLNQDSFLETLLKLHINVVQYYDWMYRHNDLIAPTSTFVDLMGRKLNQDVVRQRIALCKKSNINNMAYGAIYGASLDFFENHKDWAFYNHEKSVIKFIDIFAIMNFTNGSPWRTHLIKEYEKAIQIMGFDGIHMDTYGFPKIAKDAKENTIYLDEHFRDLINDTFEYLNHKKLSSDLIFNNVGSWPIEKTYDAKQSALYIEIWDPISTYEDIASLVRKVKALTREKELIISAYLKPYFDTNLEKAVIAHKYLYAVLSALGAHHLIMGETKKVLRTGYYCDYGSLNEKEFMQIKDYYDFNTEFSEILYDKTLDDVSLTHFLGDNIEYEFDDCNCKPHAFGKSIFTIIKENKKSSVISLINLTSLKNTNWNESKDSPKHIKNIKIKLLTLSHIEEILFVTPDDHKTGFLKFNEKSTDRGLIVEFVVPDLYIWDMIIVNKKDE